MTIQSDHVPPECRRDHMAMIRFALGIAAVGLLLIGAAIVADDEEAKASSNETFVVSLGDQMEIEGAPVNCRVTRVKGHGRRPYVECRRAGITEGTYGAFFSERDVLVTRFLGSREARVVFQATHAGSARKCG